MWFSARRFAQSHAPVTRRGAKQGKCSVKPRNHQKRPNHARRSFSDSGKQNSINDIEALSSHIRQLSQEGGTEFLKQLTPLQREQLQHLLSFNKTTIVKAATQVPEPCTRDLRLIALNTAIPFVGFGVMDNAILIIAGDAIDTSFGVLLGISTMAAAALGNIISDWAGIVFGTVIEDLVQKLNLPTPDLTTAQRQLRSVRFANQWGCGLGITVGCIIGMFPLLFIDSTKIQKRKHEAHLDSIFRDVVTEVRGLVGADRTSLYLLVDNETETVHPSPDGKFLYEKYDNRDKSQIARKKERWIPLGRGIISRAALTGESWNIPDAQNEPDFVPVSGLPREESDVRCMLCVPVMDSSGRPIAVLEAVNKVAKGVEDELDDIDNNHPIPVALGELPSKEPRSFTENDLQILKALASHISVNLQRMFEHGDEDDESRLKDTIRLLKDYGLEGISSKVGEDDKLQSIGSKRMKRPLFPED
jgi:tRNA-specific adenosine deaminase 1